MVKLNPAGVIFCTLVLASSIRPLPAQAPAVDLIRDINTRLSPGEFGNPRALVAASGGRAFFAGKSATTGEELWVSDGTSTGTFVVRDIRPGTADSAIRELIAVGSKVYFTADDGSNGRGLWSSDGTLSGTFLVKSMSPLYGPQQLTAIGSTVFFGINDGVNGDELWKSDGTTYGTVLVRDIHPGGSGSRPRYLTAVDSVLFFTAEDGSHGRELWKSDGTVAGTVLVKDLVPLFSFGQAPMNLTAVGTTLYFTADDGTSGPELWKSDGSAAGTIMVKEIRPGPGSIFPPTPGPGNLTAVGTTLFFTADDGMTGHELWKSDGSTAGTTLVSDIWAGSGNSNPRLLQPVGTTLFFAATTAAGTQLWKSDGTSTVMVKDILLGESISFAGKLYMAANDGATGRELWVSDGTGSGTTLVKDIFAGLGSSLPSYLTPISSSQFLFTADDGVAGVELWSSDGTTAGTFLLKDLYAAVKTDRSGAHDFARLPGDRALFWADDGIHGLEPWVTDGTLAGTTLVKDIVPGPDRSSTSSRDKFAEFRGQVYFRAAGGLWVSDGSSAGTLPVKASIHGISDLTVAGNTLYFVGDDGISGRELWKVDGSTGAAALVKDIAYGAGGSNPAYLTAVGSVLFFSANGIWRTDGSASGTTQVNDYQSTRHLIALGSELLFFAVHVTDFLELESGLFSTDGSAAGTRFIKAVEFHRHGVSPIAVGSVVYFMGKDDAYRSGNDYGYELWRTDGTTLGTSMLKDVNAVWTPVLPDLLGGPTSPSSMTYASNPNFLDVLGGILFFHADDGVHGRELWRTDGTTTGTFMVKAINPSTSSSSHFGLSTSILDGALYFASDDGVHGKELWRTDGTATGTLMVSDINPGVASGVPHSSLITVGNTLLFGADDGTHGLEPWILRSGSTLQFDPSKSSIEVDSARISSCGSTTIHVTPRYSDGSNMGAGQTVVLATTTGTLGPVTYDTDAYHAVLTGAPTASSATVSATVNGTPLNGTAIVTLVDVDPASSTVSSSVSTTFVNGIALITVCPRDCAGARLGDGHLVTLSIDDNATAQGLMAYTGDGYYQQKIAATTVGTAQITASVDGIDLASSTSLAVLDPTAYGKVIGIDGSARIYPYASIQQAVNAANGDQLVRIAISAGVYNEHVKLENITAPLCIEGLSATSPATLRGFVLHDTSAVQFKFLTMDARDKNKHAIHIKNSRGLVSIIGCRLESATHAGIRVAIGNSCYLASSIVANCGDEGILIDKRTTVKIVESSIENNGENGITIKEDATVSIMNSTIRGNGTLGHDNRGYGVFRMRRVGNDPSLVTLTSNLLTANAGRAIVGESTVNLANYDQILDATDTQLSY